MYHCGPTVYDRVHIGNLRAFLTADIVRRTFELLDYKVTQVMNITDVGIGGDNDEGEDKMTKGLLREGKQVTLETMKELANFYAKVFLEDLAALNIEKPHHLPKASEHIFEQIELIKKLEEKGFTYKTAGAIYFDISKDPHYGRLGFVVKDGGRSRIGINPEKKNGQDFALWKFNENLGFESPWGQGFPGWHIECSAMSQKYLGETFDIHTGGIDLASVHHNNEISQSENACGCPLAHYWLHNEFVNFASVPSASLRAGKMAKSEGNIITRQNLEEEGFSPLSYRYLMLLSHYRTPTTFTWEALQAAQNALEKLKRAFDALPEGGAVDESYRALFKERMENDLNTPQALAVVWTLVKDKEVLPEDKRATLLDFNRVLGVL